MGAEVSTYVRGEKPDDLEGYSLQVFEQNGLSPGPDSELADLIAACSRCMVDDDLAKFLRAQKKFDGPVTMLSTGQEVEHWGLRKSLKQLPDYMEAAEAAGLTYDQANDLLLHMLDSEPYDFHQEDVTIGLMTRAYRRAAEAGASIADSYETVKDMIKLGAESGVIDGCFYSFSNLMRLGLSVDQACKTVMKIPEAEGSASGYPFPHFNDAIKSMLPAKVNPDLVVEAFSILGGERPWVHLGDYQYFRAMMTFGGPSRGVTPNELLARFVTRARNGNKDTPLLEVISLKCDAGKEEPTAEVLKDWYFTETFGELEHAAQPYRNKKSLDQGVRDLEKLAVANALWDETGEGMWVFDPEKEVWYSLGGQLELPGMMSVLSGMADRVRHNFVPCDISSISKTPFLFHVHPEGLESFVAPPRDSVGPRFRDDATKFMTATPSGADYGVVASLLKKSQREAPTRSFIAHAYGVTEFTYPNSVAQLEEMKEKSRDVRDKVLLKFDTLRHIVGGVQCSGFDLVSMMVDALSKELPEGFGVILHPVGTNHNIME